MMDKYFEYRQHKTNFKTEVIAGVTTFLTMAYIMFLNPFILSGEFAGTEKGFFDFGAVFTTKTNYNISWIYFKLTLTLNLIFFSNINVIPISSF